MDAPLSETNLQTNLLQIREPFSPEHTAEVIATFERDGFVLLPGIFNADEVAALRAAVDAVFDEPRWAENGNLYCDFVGVRLFETHPIFQEALTRDPIISLVEQILGPDCHLVAQNIVRNPPGKAVDQFHVDDSLFFPVAEGMERHDPRLKMPVFILTVQMLLTDVLALDYGPSEYVPGSHYSGQQPNDLKEPHFEGRGPVPVLCRAGDAYLHNGQCWHRGAPNTSTRTRYLLQLAYSQRFVSQRFYPFVNYQFPPEVLQRADERQRRVLGFHPHAAYG